MELFNDNSVLMYARTYVEKSAQPMNTATEADAASFHFTCFVYKKQVSYVL